MTMNCCPSTVNSATSGLRLSSKAALVGSMRPAPRFSTIWPDGLATAVTASSAPPTTPEKLTREVSYRKAWRMLPPGTPPSALLMPFTVTQA